MSETKLTKNLFIPFLDVNKGVGDASWQRIDKSTIFSLNPNPQTESTDYICYESPVEEVDHYEPELPQEIILAEGNPIYDFVAKMFYDLPIGADVTVPALICFAGSDKRAWLVKDNTLQLGELNAVDGKLSFTLKLGGTITRGTYSIDQSTGAPTFTQSVTRVTYGVVAPVTGAEPQSSHDSGTGYTATVAWKAGGSDFSGSTFSASTAYQAIVTLTAASGYSFSPDFGAGDVQNLPATSGTGAPASAVTVTRVSASSATIAVTYVATAAAA